jgi:hypothetical protein
MFRMIVAVVATSVACGFAAPTWASECDDVIGDGTWPDRRCSPHSSLPRLRRAA